MRVAIWILLAAGCGHGKVRPGTNVGSGYDTPQPIVVSTPVRG